jgi:hypothetical protein
MGGGTAEPQQGPVSSAGMWTGMFLGAVAGAAAVAALVYAGKSIPPHVRCATLGALAGVLLTPIMATSSFISMTVLPFSLEGVLGDSLWGRLAKANNEKSFGPLFIPLLFFVGLPMTLGAWFGYRTASMEHGLVVCGGFGAVFLGAIIGAISGAVGGSRRPQQ